MILITGGAGYIGSHVSKQLLELDRDIIILDNLSTGSTKTLQTLRDIKDFIFIKEDLKNFDKIEEIFKKYPIKAVIHFAANIVVPESVSDPIKYYLNNTANTANLVGLSSKYKINKFIFSSTAAVYGEPKNMSAEGINEDYPTEPINPYGRSKLMSEQIIKDLSYANRDFKYVIFRYFNVAGADIFYENEELTPRIGQSFPNATHLIKIASETACHKRNEILIFGDDYDTPDGTCIRDYIHVDDLADAHIKAIDYLQTNPSDTFNIGYSKGASVKEVINTMKKVTGVDFKVKTAPRREGDPSALIADNKKIVSKMKWHPKYDDLNLICYSAYKWEKSL